jgi:hypothetical protein
VNPRIRDMAIWFGIGTAIRTALAMFGPLMHPNVLIACVSFAVAAFAIGLFSAAMLAWESRQ